MHEGIIEKLYQEYTVHGFISEDHIFDVLEENGINISGGQRQRIILARGLLKNSKIIMIDEGLSQIDINLERIILENLFFMFYDKTFIIVSHRENNIDLYDKVIRLSDSKVRSK